MKRLIIPICVIVVAMLLFSVNGKQPETAEPLDVETAAFMIRTSESRNASQCLVGKFLGDQGTRLNFDGNGTVESTAVNLDVTSGSYSLTESDGASILQMKFDGVRTMYILQHLPDEVGFRITDANGNSEVFTAVP